jgi:hypothetical protein
MGIVGGFLQAEVFLLGGDKQFFDAALCSWTPAQTCAVSFFFDQVSANSLEAASYAVLSSSVNLAGAGVFESARLVGETNSFFWSQIWAGQTLGTHLLSSAAVYPSWLLFFVSMDLGLLVAELFALGLILFVAPRVSSFRVKRRNGYDDFVTFCQTNNISLAEFGALTTMALGLVCFDFFLAFTEDDPTEVFSFLVLALALAGGFGLILALDLQYFYMISALGGGNAAIVAFNDLVANALCVLRIFLC